MDVDGLEKLLTSIERNENYLFARDVIEASPLAGNFERQTLRAYLDDAPLEERRTRAVFSAAGWIQQARATWVN